MTPDRVLLVGMMGAGKTTVGTALAVRLGCGYVDNDALLQRTCGLPGPELLAQRGTEALTEAESQVLTLQLGMPGPLVAGIAGGVVLQEADRDRIAGAGCHVVWLRATIAVLARRVGDGVDRPRLGDDLVAALRVLAAERNPFYAQLADQVVDVDALPVGAVTRAIEAELIPDLQH